MSDHNSQRRLKPPALPMAVDRLFYADESFKIIVYPVIVNRAPITVYFVTHEKSFLMENG